MAHTHTKIPLTDGETRINKLIMDFMQDGILDVHEREKKSESRLDYIETKMSDVLYKSISISDLSTRYYIPFGSTVSEVTMSWKTSKDAKYLEIISPYGVRVLKEDGEGENTALLSGNEQHNFTDESSYVIIGNTGWKLYVIEKEGKKTYEGDTITTTYADVSTYLADISCQYLFYWGANNTDSGFSADFITGLTNKKYAQSTSTDFPSTGATYKFAKGENTPAINDEYIYFAFPEGSASENILYYDIDRSGFKNELKKVATIELDFEGSKINYCLYRSDNKLTSADDVNIYVYP